MELTIREQNDKRCPRRPNSIGLRLPLPEESEWETLFESDCTMERRLSDFIEEALEHAGLPADAISEAAHKAFASTLISAEHEDGDTSLRSEWETLTPNPEYAAQSAAYCEKKAAYDAAMVTYKSDLKAYEALCETERQAETKRKELEELARLTAKYGAVK
jgi:hypothetical protein